MAVLPSENVEENIEAASTAYKVRLEVFEGPLDLLCHMVEEEKIDIWDIPIAQVTAQYLAYLDTMRQLDIDVASEFLVMAANLLRIKAQMLLPPRDDGEEAEGEEGEDPRLELAVRLMEYKLFKEAAADLGERFDDRYGLFGRPSVYAAPTGPVTYTQPVGNVTVEDLAQAFQRVLEAEQTAPRGVRLPRVKVSLPQRVAELRRRFRQVRRLPFDSLFDGQTTKVEKIVTFLAVLELVREGEVIARQDVSFGPITIESREPFSERGQKRDQERHEVGPDLVKTSGS